MDSIISQRSRILKTKLDVLSVQIVERLRIRARNLEAVLSDDVEIGNQLLGLQGQKRQPPYTTFTLEPMLHQKRFDLGKERRQIDVECWRDLTQIMREFLASWEGFELSRTREQVLFSEAKGGIDLYHHDKP